MGCCCRGKAIVGVINDTPDPPPVCTIPILKGGVLRSAAASHTELNQNWASTAKIQEYNDIAWAAHSASPWSRTTGSSAYFAFTSSAFRVYNPPEGLSFGSEGSGVSAQYVEARGYCLIPLIHEVAGTPYPMSELYGISQASLEVIANLIAYLDPLKLSGNVTDTYSNVWSDWDVYWGLVPSSQVEYSGTNPLRLKTSAVAGGLTDLATTSLTSFTLAGTPLSSLGGVSSINSIDITSLLSEDGDDFLMLMWKLDASDVDQYTTTIAVPQLPGSGFAEALRVWEEAGPAAFGGGFVSLDVTEYLILERWGCISSMILNVDIDPDGSNAVAEDRSNTAAYLSGTGLTKKFRSTDNGSVTYPTCSLVPTLRIYHVDSPLGDWSYSFADSAYQDVFEAILPNYDLNFDDGMSGCHWTATDTASGGSPLATGQVDWDLEITVNGSNPALVDMTLTVTLHATVSGVFTDDTHTIVYTLTGQDPASTGPFTLTTASSVGARTWDIGGLGGDYIIFPADFDVDTDATPTTISRIADIYLDERGTGSGTGFGGNYYFLMIDYLRETTANSAVYYVEDTFELAEVGPGTSYEVLGDLIGHEFSFTHDGDDNDDTGNGTEDVTIAFTIESISVG